MINLDNIKAMERQDPGGTAKSMGLLPDQLRQVMDDARLIKIPNDYLSARSIVVNGMGGSNLGAHFLGSVFADRLSAPLIITPGYSVPSYVDRDTLYIVSSYSGTTEEPLAAMAIAKKRGAKLMAITAAGGAKLEQAMLKDNIHGYIFDPAYNPSRQPRLGIGYSIMGQIALLIRTGHLNVKLAEMKRIVDKLEIWSRALRLDAPLRRNPAKRLARALYGRQPVLVGAEFATGVVHVIRNQFNECAKTFASYLHLPDLNHYSMEGLGHPDWNRQSLIWLFFDSALYDQRVQRRSELTRQVIMKNKVKAISYELKAETRLEQGFELLQLGIWTSFYLGMLNGVNPVLIPWVEWFKDRLTGKIDK